MLEPLGCSGDEEEPALRGVWGHCHGYRRTTRSNGPLTRLLRRGNRRRIVVGPGENDKADLWLEGDLAGILALATGKKTPARPEDERVLVSAGAAIDNRRELKRMTPAPSIAR